MLRAKKKKKIIEKQTGTNKEGKKDEELAGARGSIMKASWQSPTIILYGHGFHVAAGFGWRRCE